MTDPAMSDLGTILGVWAHPDDETYLCGGLMARAIQTGDRVVCVTATRGEQGSTDPQRWPPGEMLAQVRTVELEQSLGCLGVTEHVWLDYPDGGCADVDDAEAVARLRRIIDELRPDTVLTFGPDGMTGHPDHQAVSRWAVAAAAGTTAQVHVATNTPEWLAEFRNKLDEVGAFMGAEPPCTPRAELSIHLRLDGSLLDAKYDAILRQVSQVAPMLAAFDEDLLRAALAEESFRAAPSARAAA
ncbi:MAG: N-acetyl-D-myo-inositol-2-amino-2-deoxy-alpha-D-glucopyranoside deacetylase [Frankiaceae bacterium]|nr:N-acetyl-D-myo-inositol-2-amino-2-deoxy-alpha-D-glucopyranoside deacetylase [Frankiaceae bacterium]